MCSAGELAETWDFGLLAASPWAAGGAMGLAQSQDVSPQFRTALGHALGFYPEISLPDLSMADALFKGQWHKNS